MKKDLKLYLKLFTSSFYLSAFTFGGGYVIISLMQKKFVEDLKWIEEKEMLDLTAIAQSTPGAIAINASILIGYRVAGFWGAMTAILGTALPPLVILSVISMFYTAFRENAIINALLKGMQAGAAAVIADVVIGMGSSVIKQKEMLSILVMIGAFTAAYFFNVDVLFIILICGIIGAISAYYRGKSRKEQSEA